MICWLYQSEGKPARVCDCTADARGWAPGDPTECWARVRKIDAGPLAGYWYIPRPPEDVRDQVPPDCEPDCVEPWSPDWHTGPDLI